MAGCRECNGTGRIPVNAPGWEDHPGLTCGGCEGTGDWLAAVVWRAYMLGWSDGIDAMRKALPGDHGRRPSGERLRRILRGEYDHD